MNVEKVYRTIEKALELSENSISDESSSLNTEEWDSISHLSILVALNNLFDGKIADIQEIGVASSVKSICQILEKNSLIK